MTRGTIPFAEEECGAGGYIARRRALDGGSRQGTNKSYQLLQLPFRKLKSGHASSRDTLADQFAQVIGRASAGAFRRDDVRSSLSALAIGAVTGGAARLEVTLTRLRRLWIADLSALCRRSNSAVVSSSDDDKERREVEHRIGMYISEIESVR